MEKEGEKVEKKRGGGVGIVRGSIECIGPYFGNFTVAESINRRFPDRQTAIAKTFNAIASAGLGSCLIGVSLMDCRNRGPAVFLLATAVAFAGLHTPGAICTLVSFAPKFVGILSGATFFLVSVGCILVPIIVKAIVKTGAKMEWSRVFQIWGIMAMLPLFFFTFWGSANEQEWSKQEEVKKSKNSTNIADFQTAAEQKQILTIYL